MAPRKRFFRICANGEIVLVRSGFPLDDPDQFATRAPNGDVMIVDDGGGDGVRILRIPSHRCDRDFLKRSPAAGGDRS